MPYTGRYIYRGLMKVSNDDKEEPLDVNNDKVSESGLPQDKKPNSFGDPDYFPPVIDFIICPPDQP